MSDMEDSPTCDDFPTDAPPLSSQWSTASNESANGDGDGGWGNLQDEDELQEMSPTIPKEIEQRVRDDISELRILKKYQVADPNFGGGTNIILRFGFPVATLGLNVEQCRAWSLDPNVLLLVDLHFPSHYFNIHSKTDIKIDVHQEKSCKNPKGASGGLTGDKLDKFKLSWTLENRLRNELITKLPNMSPRPYSIDSAYEVAEITGCPFLLAVKALKKTKNNKDSAILLLSHEDTARELLSEDQKQGMATASSTSSSPSTSKSFFSMFSSSSSSSGEKKEKEGKMKGLFSYLTNKSSSSATSSSSPSSSSLPLSDGQNKKTSPKGVTNKKPSPPVPSPSKSNSNSSSSPSLSPSPDHPPSSDEQHIMDVCGVSQSLARAALSSEPNIDEAVLLLTNDVTRQQLESMIKDQHEAEKGRHVSSSVQMNFENGNIKLSGDPHELALIEEFSQYNYLVRILTFLELKLFNVNRYCLLCEKELDFAGLKPSVCGTELCKMGHDELGLGFDLITELKSNEILIDIFISFCYAAVKSSRMDFVTPAGVRVTVMEGKDGKGADKNMIEKKKSEGSKGTISAGKDYDFVDSTGKLSLVKLQTTLDRIPQVSQMVSKANNGDLTSYLNSLDPLIIPLVRWLMTSSRSHLRLLEPNERIAEMKTPYQFVLLSASPEQEMKFQSLKRSCEEKKGKGKGAIYTWHGSSTPNWHSILRIGLKNMSNTKWMSSGAAHGPGIYMACDSATSLGYSAMQGGWGRSKISPNIVALALCEVINDVKPPTPYYVVPEEEKVTTRFIFVYPQGGTPSESILAATLGEKLPKFEVPEWRDSSK